MATLKLIPGQRINLRIESVEQVQGNFGPQYAFKGETPDDQNATLYLNIDAADRQLGRLGRDVSSIVGQTVEIARTEKEGRKYTDINWPQTNGLQKAPATMPQPEVKPVATSGKQPYESGPRIPGMDDTPAAKGERWNALFSAYDVCLDHALGAAKKLEKAEIGSSPEAVAAMAATLLIQADRQGLTR